MTKNIKQIVLVAIVVFVSIFSFSYVYRISKASSGASSISVNNKNLKVFTHAELAKYNGAVKGMPIYLAMNGYVYDVSAGSKFYVTGGTYHFLAGKDSSAELNLIGGDIIRRKYPVIGILASN